MGSVPELNHHVQAEGEREQVLLNPTETPGPSLKHPGCVSITHTHKHTPVRSGGVLCPARATGTKHILLQLTELSYNVLFTLTPTQGQK